MNNLPPIPFRVLEKLQKPIFTVISALVLLIPYAIGVYTHDRLNHVRALLSIEGEVEILPGEYHLGWLRSVGTSKVVIQGGPLKRYLVKYEQDPQKINEPIEFEIHHEIQQGPVIWDNEKGLSFALARIRTTWDEAELKHLFHYVSHLTKENEGQPADTTVLEAKKEIEQVASTQEKADLEKSEQNEKEPLELWMTLTLLGDQWFDLSTRTVGIKGADTESALSIAPMTTHIELARDFKRISGLVLIPSLRLIGGDGALILKDLRAEWRLSEHETGLWMLGDTALSVQEADFQNSPQDPAILLTAARTTGFCEPLASLISCQQMVGFERMIVEHQTYGPFALETKISNLDPQSLIQMKEIQKTQEHHPLAVIAQWLQADYVKALKQLLDKKPSFSVQRFSLGTPQGEITAHFNVAFTDDDFKMEKPGEAIHALEADAYFNIPKAIVEELMYAFVYEMLDGNGDKEKRAHAKTQEILANWLHKRWVIPQAGSYITTFALKEGILVVNDEKQSL